MRVHLAGVFVIVGVLLPVILFGHWLEHASSVWVVVFAIANGLFFIVLCIGAFFLFNLPIGKQAPVQSAEEYIQELEEQELLVSTDFKAIQSFEMPEFGDEGSHYFLELEDGTVLYLNGQELYGYAPEEPLEPDPEKSHVFPCTDFTVRRHRDKGFVVDIICRGEPLELTSLESADGDDYLRVREDLPEDGDILTETDFNELKAHIQGK